jgi:hypothetical protein
MKITNLTDASRTEGNFLDGDLIEYDYGTGLIIRRTYMTPIEVEFDEEGNPIIEE